MDFFQATIELAQFLPDHLAKNYELIIPSPTLHYSFFKERGASAPLLILSISCAEASGGESVN
jgi:hypothetical protein